MGIKFGSLLTLSIFLGMISRVQALPGQNVETVSAWMVAHPTLRSPVLGRLQVERSSTPAHRFQFQASVLPPGRISIPSNRGVIRTETFSFFDQINGVSAERLAETLRIIYGAEIYQDFLQGQAVFAYPNPEMIEMALRRDLPLLAAQRGQLRLGNRYAYWLEVAETPTQQSYYGKMTVLLVEDLPLLEQELRGRFANL